MAISKPTIGAHGWGPILNATLDELDAEKLDVTTAAATYAAVKVLIADPAAADNATAISNLLASATAGQRVYIPAGTFLTSGAHTLPAGVTLEGPGTIKRTGVSTSALLSCAADSTVRDVTLDGSGVCQYVAQVSGDRVQFLNATVNDSDLYAIGNSGYDDLLVHGCTFQENDSYAVLIEGDSARCRIIGNTVTSFAVNNGQGFFMKSTGAGNTIRPVDGIIANNLVDVRDTVAIEYWGDRGAITGNVVRAGAGVIGISLALATETTVSGNTVTSSEAGSSFGVELAEACQDCTVTGNTVVGMSVGVIVAKGLQTVNPQGHTISGNTFRNVSTHGINLEYAQRCTISGNTIDNPTGAGILVGNGVANSHNHITGNLLIRRAGNPGNGISVSGTHVSVVGNHIDHSLAPSGQGIALGTGANFGLIEGNHIIACGDGIAVSGTHTYINGNQTLDSSSNAINMAGGSDYNVVGAHYLTVTGGGGVTILGANSRMVGPVYNRALNRTDTRGRIGFEDAVVAAATTPGSVVRKIEVLDKNGASLGFVPVYSAIT